MSCSRLFVFAWGIVLSAGCGASGSFRLADFERLSGRLVQAEDGCSTAYTVVSVEGSLPEACEGCDAVASVDLLHDDAGSDCDSSSSDLIDFGYGLNSDTAELHIKLPGEDWVLIGEGELSEGLWQSTTGPALRLTW